MSLVCVLQDMEAAAVEAEDMAAVVVVVVGELQPPSSCPGRPAFSKATFVSTHVPGLRS